MKTNVKYSWSGMWGTVLVKCKILEEKNDEFLIEFYDDNLDKNTQRWVSKDSLEFPETEPEPNTINWNDMSDLGLIRRINEEILHPLGLAMSRNPESGSSEAILIADDGIWEYSQPATINYSDSELIEKIRKLNEQCI